MTTRDLLEADERLRDLVSLLRGRTAERDSILSSKVLALHSNLESHSRLAMLLDECREQLTQIRENERWLATAHIALRNVRNEEVILGAVLPELAPYPFDSIRSYRRQVLAQYFGPVIANVVESCGRARGSTSILLERARVRLPGFDMAAWRRDVVEAVRKENDWTQLMQDMKEFAAEFLPDTV